MDAVDDDLYRRTKQLLQPGDIDLNGMIVHTDLTGEEDIEMTRATVEVGEIVADHADVGETYVYSGNDDDEFASNQHQGLTVDDEAFVWEVQQLLREGTFDLVFYYEADADHEAILADVRAAGYEVTGVRGDEAATGAGDDATGTRGDGATGAGEDGESGGAEGT